jgi:hypothetical protein
MGFADAHVKLSRGFYRLHSQYMQHGLQQYHESANIGLFDPLFTVCHRSTGGCDIKVIHSCSNDYPSLSVLGMTFLDYFICPCEQSAHTLLLSHSSLIS